MSERADSRHIATRSLVMFVRAMREARAFLELDQVEHEGRTYDVQTMPRPIRELVANNRVTLAWACWWQREDVMSGKIEDWTKGRRGDAP